MGSRSMQLPSRSSRCAGKTLHFGLCGIQENDAAYILDTFPIMREQDKKLYGKYRTKELILAYRRAFATGDTNSRIAA
jgi:hypothetical protein